MSETPRTDDQIGHDGSTMSAIRIEFARQLERELTAANERIKRLEDAGNDLVWWFCQIDSSQLSQTQLAVLKQWRDLRGRRNP